MNSPGGIPFALKSVIHELAWPGTAIFIGVGAGFGYWMDGVEERQREIVQRLRNKLIANRELRAQRQAEEEAVAADIYAELEKKTKEAAEQN